MFEVILKFVVVGLITGFAVGVGTARTFRLGQSFGLGAFRTYGELSSCNNDSEKLIAFGKKHSAESILATLTVGMFTQDVLLRLIPSFALGLGARANSDTENAGLSPLRLGLWGALVGGVLLGTLACLQSLIPLDASNGALTI
ncbi:MAG: DUF4311 domain-containing protein, partial [Bacilli bacterium]